MLFKIHFRSSNYILLTLSIFLIYSNNPKSVGFESHQTAAAAVEC